MDWKFISDEEETPSKCVTQHRESPYSCASLWRKLRCLASPGDWRRSAKAQEECKNSGFPETPYLEARSGLVQQGAATKV